MAAANASSDLTASEVRRLSGVRQKKTAGQLAAPKVETSLAGKDSRSLRIFVTYGRSGV